VVLVRLDLDVGGELVHVALLEVLADEGEFGLVLVAGEALLLLNDERVAVLQRVLRPPLEIAGDLRPLLESLVVPDELQQLHVLVQLPRPLFQLWREVASPVLPALLGVSEDLRCI
jgi:hypothetical protein